MTKAIVLFLGAISHLFRTRRNLLLENLALRQQLTVLKRRHARPRLGASDRLFWVLARRFWSGWEQALIIVSPETVVRWHRSGFALYWRAISRARRVIGRKRISKEVRDLIFRMVAENPTWGCAADSRRASDAGVQGLRANLFPMDAVSAERLRIVQQLREAFPYESGPRFLIFDPDAKYALEVPVALRLMAMMPVQTSFQSPWQNGVAERWIESCRHDLLNHVIALGEQHLRRLLSEYVAYYHEDRTHLALSKETPNGRARSLSRGRVITRARLGGLHHRYDRAAWPATPVRFICL